MPVATDHPDDLDHIMARSAQIVDDWAQQQARENPLVDAVERLDDDSRWFVRVKGEDKDVFSVWFWLRQRTLHIETQFMPAPEENVAQLYEYLLTKNYKLFGLTFSIGPEQALYLSGQMHATDVSFDELDRLLGTAYQATEDYFRAALRLGFASRVRRASESR